MENLNVEIYERVMEVYLSYLYTRRHELKLLGIETRAQERKMLNPRPTQGWSKHNNHICNWIREEDYNKTEWSKDKIEIEVGTFWCAVTLEGLFHVKRKLEQQIPSKHKEYYFAK